MPYTTRACRLASAFAVCFISRSATTTTTTAFSTPASRRSLRFSGAQRGRRFLAASSSDKSAPPTDEGEFLSGPEYVTYADKLCGPGEDSNADELGEDEYGDEECLLPEDDEFVVGILGDLHLDPRAMDDYYVGRDHFLPILADAQQRGVNVAMVSLGDLGESKSVRPKETTELFAGTTECHEMAAEFLSSFGGVPYEVVGGNHDLEGIDEFPTDAENLEMYLRVHGKETAHFKREIAEKTLLVGLGSTVFREAKFTSHEVIIDDDQIRWFEDTVAAHPAEEGWKVIVFTHAPPIGSGIRVIQENHVVNGCCWLNHSGEWQTKKFIELVRKHRCIKAWFSGHFHLGQDYEDSITFPTIPREQGPYPNRGSCVFAQTSVMRSGTSRDKRQQSRLIRGNAEGFEICTVDHAAGGTVRLDATITYTDSNHEVGHFAHKHAELSDDNGNFVRVYSPSKGDGCEVFASTQDATMGAVIEASGGKAVDASTVSWWEMNCGRVLGIYDGRLIEYEPSTLAPLGLVVGADELAGRRVIVVSSGLDAACRGPVEVSTGARLGKDGTLQVKEEQGMEGAECGVGGDGAEEQAVLLIDEVTGTVVVVQPNEDGSYWRKIVRNKIVRMKEKRREEAAKILAAELATKHAEQQQAKAAAEEAAAAAAADSSDSAYHVVSTWGPYTQISGNAKRTAVPGLMPASPRK